MTEKYPNIPKGAEFYEPVGPHLMAREVLFSDDELTLVLKDGRRITVPLEWFPRLLEASPEEREEFEIVGAGGLIDWPEIEESILVRRLLHQSAEGIQRNVEEGRDLIHRMVDELESEDVPAAERFVAFLSAYRRDVFVRSLSTAPWEDEPITVEEQRAVEEARQEMSEGIAHEDLKRFGLDNETDSDGP